MFCPNCGNNCGDANFCPNCGQRLKESVITASAAAHAPDAKDDGVAQIIDRVLKGEFVIGIGKERSGIAPEEDSE